MIEYCVEVSFLIYFFIAGFASLGVQSYVLKRAITLKMIRSEFFLLSFIFAGVYLLSNYLGWW